MKNLIMFLGMQAFILSLSAQEEYLILTRERDLAPRASRLAELPAAVAYELLLKDHMPKVKPVERKIKEGVRVKVRTYEANRGKIKGRLDIISDSTISVGTRAVILTDIRKIFVKTTFSQVAGPIISGGGVAGTILITPAFFESLALFEGTAIEVLAGIFVVPMVGAAVIGCACAAMGGIIYFLKGRVFNTVDNWYSRTDGWQLKIAQNFSKPPPGPQE